MYTVGSRAVENRCFKKRVGIIYILGSQELSLGKFEADVPCLGAQLLHRGSVQNLFRKNLATGAQTSGRPGGDFESFWTLLQGPR